MVHARDVCNDTNVQPVGHRLKVNGSCRYPFCVCHVAMGQTEK